jgi:inward rectifier potassium channel
VGLVSTANQPQKPVITAPAIYSTGRLRYESRGLRVTPLSDLYHFFMKAAWWKLLLSFGVIYCAANAAFAVAYWWGGPGTVLNARAGSFADDFWFSVQTFATIGYGNLSPGSTYAHVLVTVESFAGMLAVAFGTGILFAKFSRPMARVAFSKNVVVGSRNGQPCLMWRIANRRGNALLDATVQGHALIDEVSSEGHRMRRVHALELERSGMPMFMLSWTVIHPLDAKSPLFGLSPENAGERLVGLIVSFSGVDDTMVQTVHARQMYNPADLRFRARFVDMIDNSTPGTLIIDHAQLDELVAEEGPRDGESDAPS